MSPSASLLSQRVSYTTNGLFPRFCLLPRHRLPKVPLAPSVGPRTSDSFVAIISSPCCHPSRREPIRRTYGRGLSSRPGVGCPAPHRCRVWGQCPLPVPAISFFSSLEVMGSMPHRPLLAFLALVLALGYAAEVRAGFIITPSGLNPGDQFRIVFVTSRNTRASSTDMPFTTPLCRGSPTQPGWGRTTVSPWSGTRSDPRRRSMRTIPRGSPLPHPPASI